MNRRFSLACLAATALALAVASPHAADDVQVRSPNGALVLAVSTGAAGTLSYTVTLNGSPVLEPSPLGLLVDGKNLGESVTVGHTEAYQVRETYPWRGVHSEARNHANGARASLQHASGTTYTLDVRVFDDAAAFRMEVPGQGRRVPDAASGFTLPAGSIVWSHGLGNHYEGLYARRSVDELPGGEWFGPPVTFKLPGGRGYAAITEADLHDYAGMVLQADAGRVLSERLGHAPPAGYPFTLRYGNDEAARLSTAAAIDGPITTPWRVVMAGRDLNALVNSDAVPNLSRPPDPKIFPQGIRTPWIRPGRAVWRYLDGGESTPEGIKELSRLASELGFEYQVVEGQWQKWTDEELRDVVEYSRSRNVGIWVWRHRNTLGDPVERRKLFAHLQKMGVVGVKVDFLDHEAKEVVDLYQAILQETAEHRLMVNFHGANKPAGESRTWPNEMTREAIWGLERRSTPAWAEFNTTFPFTRLLAGPADYTPVVFGAERRKDTSWSHQIASAVILTSPVLIYGGHPSSFLRNPAADMLRSIPSVWDDTRVLPPSEIGELAMFARRNGDRWFIAAMNGPEAGTVTVDLSFLPPGSREALIVRDDLEDPAAVKVEKKALSPSGTLEIPMRAAGGFIVRIG